MRLDRAARKRVRWPFTADVEPPPTTVEVWLAGAWHTATVDGGEAELLLAGPDFDGADAGEVVLPLGLHLPRIRCTDSPEVLVEDGGVILVN